LGNVRQGDHLEDPGVDEKIILKCILEKWYGKRDMHSIDLAQNRDRWRALLNVVMSLRIP
jgi:hypothetical protein